MSSNVTFNGVTYSIPAEGDSGWGPDLTAYFISIASNAFQKTGGSFTLTSEANFGATYGLKSAYLKSQSANPASGGIVRLGNTEAISWRNNANSADLALTSNASDQLLFNSTKLLLSGSIVNADVNAAAAIAYSKLNLSSSIVNADISASAAIAYSKLNLATSIVNADISASAAIAYSKLSLTGSILNADLAGSIDAAKIGDGSVSTTEFQYINSLTSNAQTQLDSKITQGAVQTKTANYTVLSTDGWVLCDASSAAFTLTFPAATGLTGKVIVCKKTDTSFNAITISGTGMTTNYLMTTGETVYFISNGTNWIQLERKTDLEYGVMTWTPTGSWSTNTTYVGKVAGRDGNFVLLDVLVTTSGAPTTATLTINIPSAWTINTSNEVSIANFNMRLGFADVVDSATQYYPARVRYSSTTAVGVFVEAASGTYVVPASVDQATPFTFGAADYVACYIKVPITNFSA